MLRYVGLLRWLVWRGLWLASIISLGIFYSVDILKIDVDMSFGLGYRDMATIATNDDPSNIYMHYQIGQSQGLRISEYGLSALSWAIYLESITTTSHIPLEMKYSKSWL